MSTNHYHNGYQCVFWSMSRAELGCQNIEPIESWTQNRKQYLKQFCHASSHPFTFTHKLHPIYWLGEIGCAPMLHQYLMMSEHHSEDCIASSEMCILFLRRNSCNKKKVQLTTHNSKWAVKARLYWVTRRATQGISILYISSLILLLLQFQNDINNSRGIA